MQAVAACILTCTQPPILHPAPSTDHPVGAGPKRHRCCAATGQVAAAAAAATDAAPTLLPVAALVDACCTIASPQQGLVAAPQQYAPLPRPSTTAGAAWWRHLPPPSLLARRQTERAYPIACSLSALIAQRERLQKSGGGRFGAQACASSVPANSARAMAIIGGASRLWAGCCTRP